MTAFFHIFRNSLFPNFQGFRSCIIRVIDRVTEYMHNNNNNNNNVTMLWNQAVHTDRVVAANKPDVIINLKKREDLHTDSCGNTRRQMSCKRKLKRS
jgi:hypothetical protein